jgi:sortase B
MTEKKDKTRRYRLIMALLALIFLISAGWFAYYLYDDYRSRATLAGLAEDIDAVRHLMSGIEDEVSAPEPTVEEKLPPPDADKGSGEGEPSAHHGTVASSSDKAMQTTDISLARTDRPGSGAQHVRSNSSDSPSPAPPSPVSSPAPSPTPSASAGPSSTVLPVQADPLSLHYASLQALNPDFAGWIHIDNTIVDYPVMYTPDELEKYLHRNFEGHYSFAGLPFMDITYPPDSTGVNQIIYAHNMKSGQMFAVLNEYLKDDFWQEYRTLSFHTLNSRRDYEVLALIPLVLGRMDEPRMMIFHPLTTDNERSVAEINDYLAAYARRFDGRVLQGDDLLTLVTCRRARDSDRLLLVARRVDTLP